MNNRNNMSESSSALRRYRAWLGGKMAESLAVWRLRFTGHHILARNWRSPVGEIDIVARRGKALIIVEVKRRIDHHTALYAISSNQQKRLIRAALAFQQRRRDCRDLTCRFDVIVFGRDWRSGGLWPKHIKEAWRPTRN